MDTQQFGGFHPLNANFLYCPNQFFDVCLPNCSRGAVRLVAYILRQTLGWLDKNGNPIQQEIMIPYRDFINKAGISRGALPDVINEVVDAGFITSVSPARAKSRGLGSMSGVFKLRWASTDAGYVTDLQKFSGFFSGEGNRTPIPNDFFDLIIPSETLASTRVVGIVLRHTVGYQNQFGGRRQEAALSFTLIQKLTNVRSPDTLNKAMKNVLSREYIVKRSAGVFHSSARSRKTAVYSPHWQTEEGSITAVKSKFCSTDRFKKRSSISNIDQSEKRSSNGSENVTVDQAKKRSNRKNKEKDTQKQQQIVAADNSHTMKLLHDAGFDTPTASKLAASFSQAEIRQQIEWLPTRNAARNPIGLLRKAIEENWAKPAAIEAKEKLTERRETDRLKSQAASDEEARNQKRHRFKTERRSRLLSLLNTCSPEDVERFRAAAITQETSVFLKSRLARPIGEMTTTERDRILDKLAIDRGLETVFHSSDSLKPIAEDQAAHSPTQKPAP